MTVDTPRKHDAGAFSQDATVERLPATAVACIALAVVQVVGSVCVLLSFGTGGLVLAADPAEMKWFQSATVMLLPAMLLEAAHTISSRSRGLDVELHGRELSAFVVVEYVVKMLCYGAMANFEGGIVHTNMRAVGPARGCYTFRYIAWSVAVPTLIALNNYPLWSKSGVRSMAVRLWPNLLVTWSYVLASWVAQVTPCGVAGWCLVVLSFASYAAAAIDQACILSQADRTMLGFKFKVGTVVVKEVLFVAYGATYLSGAMNLTSPASEQFFYTAGDVLLKVVQASVLVVVRNWEDLAELRQALERKVEAGKEDMCRLFRHASAPIFTMTQDGVVVAWNEHLGLLSGVQRAEALGTSIFDLVRDECHSLLRSALASCGSGLSSSAVEVTLRGGAESERPVQMLLTLIVQLGADDERRTITAIGQDLTEVGAMRAMQERKSQITAVLGHELRSPLHGIMGLSGSLAEAAPTPAQKRQLSMIKGCAARLLDLVTNIMEMAKSEKLDSSEPIHKEPVNLMDIVDEVVGMSKAAVDKNGRHLLNDGVEMMNGMSRGELPMVFGDRYKLTQLFYNLVTNAAKFTTSGSIQVFAREVEERGALEIDITDTGKGIAPEALARIFDPFQQEEDKDARSFKGIGLGLSVAMGIAKLHGGGIRVASRAQKGSTFTIFLPCDFESRAGLTASCEEDDEAAAPCAPPDSKEALEQGAGPEYRVARAANREEALRQLKASTERPAMMFLELPQPGFEGLEVEKLGQRAPQLPVLTLFHSGPPVDGEKTLRGVLGEIKEEAQQCTKPRQPGFVSPRAYHLERVDPALFSTAECGESNPTSTEESSPSSVDEDGTPVRSTGGSGSATEVNFQPRSAFWGEEEAEAAAPRRRRASESTQGLRATLAAAAPWRRRSELPGTAGRSAPELDAFYREEIEVRDRKLRELSERSSRDRTAAWTATCRAEALDRELRFVKQLRRPIG